MRRGFTLTELLVVMCVLAILAGLVLAGLSSAVNDATRSRTRTIITKVDQILMYRWEHWRDASLALDPSAIAASRGNTRQMAIFRLGALRESQRLELPDRISDLCNDAELADLTADQKLDAIADFTTVYRTSALSALPSITRGYKRLAERSIEDPANPRPWSTEYQGSECLYLILSMLKDNDKSALDYFQTSDIGDVDGDGMKEILDGWGRPLEFIRWPAGYTIQNLATTDQTADTRYPDPFDPLKVDTRENYAIRPLIYSAGLDGLYEVNRGVVIYSWPTYPAPMQPTDIPNDPYLQLPSQYMVGTPDPAVDGWKDNVTNHYVE